jgi:hypothetical protein
MTFIGKKHVLSKISFGVKPILFHISFQEKIQCGEYFQDGVSTFLLHEYIFCERSIRYIKLIFGVARYFLIK